MFRIPKHLILESRRPHDGLCNYPNGDKFCCLPSGHSGLCETFPLTYFGVNFDRNSVTTISTAVSNFKEVH